MLLEAQELALVHYSLNQISVSEQDRSLLRESCEAVLLSTEGENEGKHFVDGDISLSTLQKAFIIKSLRSLSWNKNSWDVVDKIIEKLN